MADELLLLSSTMEKRSGLCVRLPVACPEALSRGDLLGADQNGLGSIRMAGLAWDD